MDKDSLIKAREIIISALDKNRSKFINKLDFGELMLNLYNYLDIENYEKSNKILIRETKKHK